MRAGLKGHRHLINCNILHRDISINNIILPIVGLGNGGSGEEGFLIDLDHAMDYNRKKASDAKRRIGTPLFMAIEVLDHKTHTYFHEPTLLLIWAMIPCGPNPTVDSALENWKKGTYETLAAFKSNIMFGSVWKKYKKEALRQWEDSPEVCGALRELLDSWIAACFPRAQQDEDWARTLRSKYI